MKMSGWGGRQGGLREDENDGAAAEFAGGDAEAAEMQADFRQGHLRGAGFLEQRDHVAPDVAQQRPGVGGRDGGGDDVAVAIHRQAAERQLLNAGVGAEQPRNFIQESHEATSFLLFSISEALAVSGGQATRKDFSPRFMTTTCRSTLCPKICSSGPASIFSPSRPAASAAWRVQLAAGSAFCDCVPSDSTAPWFFGGTAMTNSAPSRVSNASFQTV